MFRQSLAALLVSTACLGCLVIESEAPRVPAVEPTSSLEPPAFRWNSDAGGLYRRFLNVGIRPRTGVDGEVAKLEVTIELEGEGAAVFGMPAACSGETGWADRIEGLTIEDDYGVSTLPRVHWGEGDKGEFLWSLAHRPSGKQKLHYLVTVPKPTRVGFGMSAESGGVGASGCQFLVLPWNDAHYRTTIRWDLSGLAAGSSAIGSLGEDGASTSAALWVLRNARFLAGPLQRASRPADGLRAAWLGKPAFDIDLALAFASRVDSLAQGLFGAKIAEKPLFLLQTLRSARQPFGESEDGSFLVLLGPDTPWDADVRLVIAHEMIHRWLGGALVLDSPDGAARWFIEGFTTHYARELLFRNGLLSSEEYAADLKHYADYYYSSVLDQSSRHLDNRQIDEEFWRKPFVALVPYARGSFYAAELDAALRQKSGSRRSLDPLLRDLLHEAKRANPTGLPGSRLDATRLRDLVVQDLGEQGAARFDAVIVRGELAAPPENAYGPCFKRAKRQFYDYDIGFEAGLEQSPPAQVRGLVQDSEAGRAGLKEGDTIVSLDLGQRKTWSEVKVQVRRGTKTREIRYYPRRVRLVDAEWKRIPGIPEKDCAKDR